MSDTTNPIATAIYVRADKGKGDTRFTLDTTRGDVEGYRHSERSKMFDVIVIPDVKGIGTIRMVPPKVIYAPDVGDDVAEVTLTIPGMTVSKLRKVSATKVETPTDTDGAGDAAIAQAAAVMTEALVKAGNVEALAAHLAASPAYPGVGAKTAATMAAALIG